MPAFTLILPMMIGLLVATIVTLDACNKLTLGTAALAALPALISLTFYFISLLGKKGND